MQQLSLALRVLSHTILPLSEVKITPPMSASTRQFLSVIVIFVFTSHSSLNYFSHPANTSFTTSTSSFKHLISTSYYSSFIKPCFISTLKSCLYVFRSLFCCFNLCFVSYCTFSIMSNLTFIQDILHSLIFLLLKIFSATLMLSSIRLKESSLRLLAQLLILLISNSFSWSALSLITLRLSPLYFLMAALNFSILAQNISWGSGICTCIFNLIKSIQELNIYQSQHPPIISHLS